MWEKEGSERDEVDSEGTAAMFGTFGYSVAESGEEWTVGVSVRTWTLVEHPPLVSLLTITSSCRLSDTHCAVIGAQHGGRHCSLTAYIHCARCTSSHTASAEMPPLSIRNVNIHRPTPPLDQPLKAPSISPKAALVCERCALFISKVQAQYEAAQLHPSPSSASTPPPDLPSLLSTLSSTPSFAAAARAYEQVGAWLYAVKKYPQAVQVLHSALSLHDSTKPPQSSWRLRLSIGRAMGAAEEKEAGNWQAVHLWWAALLADVSGTDLELHSSAAFHSAHFHAKLFSLTRETSRPAAVHHWQQAVDGWSRLEAVPTQHHPPSLRVSSTPAMQKHRKLALEAAEMMESTGPYLVLYGHGAEYVATQRCLSSLLSSVLHFTAAALPLLHCALHHFQAGDVSTAAALLGQAEELRHHSQDASPPLSSYHYDVLYCRLRLLLHPAGPLPSLSHPLPTARSSLSIGPAIARNHGYAVEAQLRWKAGRGEESLSVCRREYEGWSKLVHRMTASVGREEKEKAAAVVARPTKRSPPLIERGREEMKEADESVDGTRLSEYSPLLSSLSSLSTPHTFVVLLSFLGCLRSYAAALERLGHTRDALQYLQVALAFSQELEECQERPWLLMLDQRMKAKLPAAEFPVHPGGDEAKEESRLGLVQVARCVELADVARRTQRYDESLHQYREALTLLDAICTSTPSASPAPLASETDVSTKPARVVRRPARGRAKKATTDAVVQDAARHPLSSIRAQIEAKMASLSLCAPSIPHSSPLASLSRYSPTFEEDRQHVDHAWSLYYQAVATPAEPSSTLWTASLLTTARTCPPSSSLSLLTTALDVCFGLAPPYLTRRLFLCQCEHSGLTAVMDAVFALNESVGITVRHQLCRSLHRRPSPRPSADSSLATALSSLSLTEAADDADADAGVDDGGEGLRAQLQPLFSFEGGVAADRQRFEDEYLHALPVEWTVITVTLSEDEQELFLSRVQSPHHGVQPLILRLPLAGLMAEVQGELSAILAASGEMNDSVKSPSGWSAEDKEGWWAGRYELNERMRKLTNTLEDGFFGPWKGALLGLQGDEEDRQRLQTATLKAMAALTGTKTSAASLASPLYPYVQAVVDGAQGLTDTQLDAALMYLLGWTDAMSASDGDVAALRQGRRPADCQHLQRVRTEVRRQAKTSSATTRLPVILLLSSHLQSLPFEAMPVLSEAAVSRMPSWLFLLRHLPPYSVPLVEGRLSPLSVASHSFILNPAADLPTTEATFSRVLPALNITRGTTRVLPTPASFLSALSSDLFVYLGHGSGAQYIPSSLVEAKASPGVALLMGCSSGRLKGVSREYDGWGMATALMVAGAKAVVGNLWDVTDGEIDRFAIKALELISGRSATQGEEGEKGVVERASRAGVGKGKVLARGKEKAPVARVEPAVELVASAGVLTISEVVRDSRSACKLRYLMGASPVVFGLPVAFNR